MVQERLGPRNLMKGELKEIADGAVTTAKLADESHEGRIESLTTHDYAEGGNKL